VEILDGLIVFELFASGPPLTIRRCAQLLRPEAYPQNLQSVLEAVEDLLGQGLLVLGRGLHRLSTEEEGVALDDLLFLGSLVREEVLEALRRDPISAREAIAFKRRLHAVGKTG